MFKKRVIDFFNTVAPHWDDHMDNNPIIRNTILNNSLIKSGADILDVACGTGTMIPYYLERNPHSITAIDISPEMIKIAKKKFQEKNITIICGDIETTSFNHKFDNIIVYNAFPHFEDSQKLISILSSHLKLNGTLTIAHGMSRKKLAQHHSGAAHNVSIPLISENELSSIFEKYLNVTCKISNQKMYQVVGIKSTSTD